MGKVSAKAMMQAAAKCNLAEIHELMAAGVSRKHLVTSSMNAVTEAAFGWWGGMDQPEAVRIKVIQELVAAGCQVEGNALFRPVDREELEILKFLIENGADLNAESPREYYWCVPKGVCPLYVAIKLKRLRAFALLVAAGADVNQVTGPILRFGFSVRAPLIFWASNFVEGVSGLKKAGADLEALSSHGRTALIQAVFQGHSEVVEALIVAGADVNHASTDGWSPLKVARENEYAEIERMLLKAGAKQ